MVNVYKEYTPPSGGGLFHKFEDGVTYMFRIASEPVVLETHFEDQKTGEVTVSTKYAWVAWNVADKAAKILQLPVTAYKMVAALASDSEYGDPQMYNLKITRKGTSLETTYTVIASPNKSELKELDAAAPEKVAEIDLIEEISKGKNVAHAFWLAEAIGKDSKKAMPVKAVTDAEHAADEPNDGKDPIDLSEIPF